MENLFENEVNQEVVEAFENILKAQTETYGVFELEYLSSLIERLGVKKVLDIGTGDGSFLLELAKRFNRLNFVGIDHNNSFLQKAENERVSQNVVNVKFERAFFDSTYPSDGFDMILALMCITKNSNKMIPEVWDDTFLTTFEGWLNEVVQTRRIDPFITIAHVTAEKMH